MEGLSLTSDELIELEQRSGVERTPDYQSPVQWAPLIGAYVIDNIAIYYCPWCGARLPEEIEKALAEASQTGIWVSSEANGEVVAKVDGVTVDYAELMAKLTAETKEQD